MQCQAITSVNRRCSRKATKNSSTCKQHQIPEKNILQKLSNNEISHVGQFLGYSDIRNTKLSKFPSSIYTLKNCITIIYDLDTLPKVILSITRLKDLTISDYYFLAEEFTTFINLLKSIKNLEALTISLYNQDFIADSTSIVDWSGFKLKYLNLGIFRAYDIHDVTFNIPTLQTIVISPSNDQIYYNEYNLKSEEHINIPNTLKTLNLENISDYPNFKLFPYIKELNLGFVKPIDIILIAELKQLEILTIKSDDFDFLDDKTLTYFPTNLKFLYLDYIGYQDNWFIRLNFPQLEYLELKNLSSLGHIIDIIFEYPKLQHLCIQDLKFRSLNAEFLKKLKELVDKKPKLTFDFYITRYEKLSLQTEEYKNIDPNNDETESELKELIKKRDEEQKAQKLYWPSLQEIFDLANLITDKNGYEYLEKLQYPPIEWARDHGYYIKENCKE